MDIGPIVVSTVGSTTGSSGTIIVNDIPVQTYIVTEFGQIGRTSAIQ